MLTIVSLPTTGLGSSPPRPPDIECEKQGPRLRQTAGARAGGTSARLVRLPAGSGALLLGAAIALAAFTASSETMAQQGKPATRGSAQPAKAKADAAPEELYGDQGGEKVAPANPRLPNAVMRARREDTFLKLSNPRLGEGSSRGPKRVLLVDYEVVSRGKFDGGTLVLRASDGSKAEVQVKSIAGRDSGTIELIGAQRFGNIKIARNIAVPEKLELFMTRVDDRYDPPGVFLVSNAVTMGKMKTATRGRNWTPAEIKKYNGPPAAYKNLNGFPEVGEDVPALPNAAQPQDFRYVDPEGRLLGLDYLVGNWEKQKAVWRLTPVFSINQPKSHQARSIARKGYAVAGAEVNVTKYVCGIRLLFRRVKKDGTFDDKDAYVGEWIGTPPSGEATKLVNDGRRVLGIHFQMGAIVDRFSLVVADEAK